MLLHRAGYIDQVVGLETTRYILNETEYVPWMAALNNLAYIRDMLDRSESYGLLEVCTTKLITKKAFKTIFEFIFIFILYFNSLMST